MALSCFTKISRTMVPYRLTRIMVPYCPIKIPEFQNYGTILSCEKLQNYGTKMSYKNFQNYVILRKFPEITVVFLPRATPLTISMVTE